MQVNYVLMYGTPYLKYAEFETFEDVSKFINNKGIVDYSIFKKIEDKEEVEMIYRDNDIRYLKSIIQEAREHIERYLRLNLEAFDTKDLLVKILEILDSSEDNDSPYCEVCGHCGEIECCGIRDFIEHHIKGKTNCKNEQDIIYELIDLCDYKDEVFKENEKLKKEIEKYKQMERNTYETSQEMLGEQEQELKEANDSITWWSNRFKVVERDKIRLNNIINELEEYIKPFLYMLNGITDKDEYEQAQLDAFTDIMEKLQELKGSDKE